MKDVLDNIAEDLEVVETRILAEFHRIQEADETGFGSLPVEFREEIRYTVMALKEALERTGSKTELQLTTDRHEDLRTRLYVITQLLDRKIPMAAFTEADNQLHDMASTPARASTPSPAPKRSQATTTARTSPKDSPKEKDSSTILDSIRSFFRGKDKTREATRITSMEVEEKEPVFKEIYKEDGVYGAAQELAMLALVISDTPPPVKAQVRRPKISGRASFEARDLSSSMTDVPAKPKARPETPERKDIAQTPEEIRRKLEARKNQSGSAGKAVFGASDVKGANESSGKSGPATQKGTPREIKPQPAKGRAVFESRDVKSIATDPQKIREKLADPADTDDKKKGGSNDK